MKKSINIKDMINVKQIIDGFIITDTEQPLAIYRLKGGINSLTATDESISQAFEGFKSAFNTLKPGEEVQIILDTKKYDSDEIILKYNSFIDKNHAIEEYKTVYPNYLDTWAKGFCRENNIIDYNFYVLFTYKPTEIISKGISNLLSKKKTVKKDVIALTKDINLRSRPFLTSLRACKLDVVDMNAQEIKDTLDHFLNPTQTNRTPIEKTKQGFYDLKSTLARTPLAETADKVLLGNQYIKTVYIGDTPEQAGLIQDLYFKQNLFTFVLYAKGVNQIDIKSSMKKNLKLSISAGGGVADIENQEIASGTREILSAQARGELKFINFACYLSFKHTDADKLEEITPDFTSALSDSALFYEGYYEQAQLWQATLPLMRNSETANHYYLTLTGGARGLSGGLANLFPFYNFEFDNSEGGAILGTSITGQLACYNPWNKKLINGNQVIIGQPGSGKSFFINLVLNRLMPWNIDVIIIDKSKSYEYLCKCNNGQYLEIGLTGKNAYNVFDCLDYDAALGDDNDINSKGEPTGGKISFVAGLFDVILTEEGEKRLNKIDSSLVEKIIKQTYKNKLEVKDGKVKRQSIPLLSDTIKVIEVMAKDKENESWKEELLRIKEKLSPFVFDGTYAPLLDRPTNIELKSSFIVFDISSIPNRDDIQSLAVYIISSFCMQRFIINKKLGRRQLHCIDEAWYLARFSAGIEYLLNLAKRSRHLGLMVMSATQQIGDFLNKPESAQILKSAATITIFKQSSTDLEHLQNIFELNDREKQILSSLHQVRGKYSQALMIIGEHKNTLNIRADAMARWICTSEPTYDTPKRNKALEKTGGNAWEAVFDLIEQG